LAEILKASLQIGKLKE